VVTIYTYIRGCLFRISAWLLASGLRFMVFLSSSSQIQG
jgi:hypothetical protein